MADVQLRISGPRLRLRVQLGRETGIPEPKVQAPALSPELVWGLIETLAPMALIDVRQSSSFLVSRLPGALTLNKARGLRLQGHTLVIYDQNGEEGSRHFAQYLRNHELDAAYLSGGLEEWSRLGLPLEGTSIYDGRCYL